MGCKSSPLIWCRIAGAAARLAQGMFPDGRIRIQTYIDDPAGPVVGTLEERGDMVCCVLLLQFAGGD